MAANGRPVEITFTPAVAGNVKVTATFTGLRSMGSDWGASAGVKCFAEQSSTITYGGNTGLTSIRVPYTIQSVFAVTAGSAVTCGVYGYVTGASSCTLYDFNVVVEFNPA